MDVLVTFERLWLGWGRFLGVGGALSTRGALSCSCERDKVTVFDTELILMHLDNIYSWIYIYYMYWVCIYLDPRCVPEEAWRDHQYQGRPDEPAACWRWQKWHIQNHFLGGKMTCVRLQCPRVFLAKYYTYITVSKAATKTWRTSMFDQPICQCHTPREDWSVSSIKFIKWTTC